MNASVAGELVAKFLDKSWPNDKKAIFKILKLGINKAWQEGKWFGMTAEFSVPVEIDSRGNRFFIAPVSHPILLAINSNGVPTPIRDIYFKFHRNGKGDIKSHKGCNWREYVYDLGTTPILRENNINFCNGVTIGVRAIGPSGPNEKVFIKGKYIDGNKIYTYQNTDYGKDACGCSVDKFVETVNGVSIDISRNFTYISNIKFASIEAISKTITRTPIEVIAIDEFGTGHLISRLEPNQKQSLYRKYDIPAEICNNSIHALFKIGTQEDIVNDTDDLIINNEEALISFSIGIHNMYHKSNLELGAAYILQGISILEKQKREEESPTEFPIQVDGIMVNDMPSILRNNY